MPFGLTLFVVFKDNILVVFVIVSCKAVIREDHLVKKRPSASFSLLSFSPSASSLTNSNSE